MSDSYDVFKACSEIWGETLRSKVLGREGTLVVRPDSGEPCATSLKCLELLYEKFGGPLARVGRLEVPSLGVVVVGRPTRRRHDGRGDGLPVGPKKYSNRVSSTTRRRRRTPARHLRARRRDGFIRAGQVNEKGYKVLDPHVRLIWGDGIDYQALCTICATLKANGWSLDNIAFGSGGGLLQKLNRDTQKCAFKCSSITVGGQDRDVFKDPVTDPGKASKRGRLALVADSEGSYVTKTACPREGVPGDVLVEVFRDGTLLVDQSFDDVRARAAIPDPSTLPLLGSVAGAPPSKSCW